MRKKSIKMYYINKPNKSNKLHDISQQLLGNVINNIYIKMTRCSVKKMKKSFIYALNAVI